MPLLEVNALHSGYGKIQILQDITLKINKGEFVSIIGANGTGKTTLLRTISGLTQISSGEVMFNGVNIRHYPPHKLPGLGIGHVPEGRQIFPQLTVLENLLVGYVNQTEQLREQQLELIYGLFPRLTPRRP